MSYAFGVCKVMDSHEVFKVLQYACEFLAMHKFMKLVMSNIRSCTMWTFGHVLEFQKL